jgi:hypothetical protein
MEEEHGADIDSLTISSLVVVYPMSSASHNACLPTPTSTSSPFPGGLDSMEKKKKSFRSVFFG